MFIKIKKGPTPIIDFFSKYSDVFTAIASIGAVVAILISIVAIYKSSKDNRNQILIVKFEEIYQLIVCLSVEYKKLFEIYIEVEEHTKRIRSIDLSENLRLDSIRRNIKISITDNYLEELYQKTIRLNVLSNAYLTKDLKYDVIAYSQIFSSIIHVLKTGDVNAKINEYPEMLPLEEKVLHVTADITNNLILQINLGTPNIGYRLYRDNKFKAKLGI